MSKSISDLFRRSQKAKAIAEDQSMKKWQQAAQTFQSFSELELTGLPQDVRTDLEADFIAVNRILAKYPIQTADDYEHIHEADLQEILDIVNALAIKTESLVRGQLNKIIAELDAAGRKLPVAALQEAREYREQITPKLIDVIRKATADAQAGNAPEGNAHFFALFLLTEFQAKEALPAIIKAVSLPGERPFDLFGDAITSMLSRVLVALIGEQLELVDTLIRNREINQSVRWAAAHCFLHLVRDGRMERDEAIQRLQQYLHEAMANDDEEIVFPLVVELDSYAPAEAMKDIEDAFQRRLVDPLMICLDDVKQSIKEGSSRMRKELERCEPSGIEDTVEELQHWAAFREEFDTRTAEAPSSLPHRPIPIKPFSEFSPMDESPRPRIGRNDPCPCGSGKKFKKCCGARKQQ